MDQDQARDQAQEEFFESISDCVDRGMIRAIGGFIVDKLKRIPPDQEADFPTYLHFEASINGSLAYFRRVLQDEGDRIGKPGGLTPAELLDRFDAAAGTATAAFLSKCKRTSSGN